jgi:TAZ zinc finger
MQKKVERSKRREEEKTYSLLFDAMEALVHICQDGCINIGPADKSFNHIQNQGRNCHFSACKTLELLVRHFRCCEIGVPGGCANCKRMWQLLELHSRMCTESCFCKVPLCR